MIWLLAGGLLLLSRVGRGGGVSSSADPSSSSPGAIGLPIDPAWLPAVSASLTTSGGRPSWLYYWGGPQPINPAGMLAGVPFAGPLLGDCSGAARVLYITAGKAPITMERFASSSIAGSPSWVRVSDSDIRAGDLLLYSGHVAVCVGGAGADNATVWSMSGGTSKTVGNDLNAHPKIYRGARYRSGFIGAYRRRA